MAFRSSTNITPGNGTSFAISVPTGAASGDIAVVTMYCEVEDTITAPSGFTQKSDPRAGTAATTGRLIVFWKRLSAADTGTYTFSWTNSSWRDASCALFSGRSTSGDPFEASNTGVASGNTVTVTAITATANADLYGGTICYNTGDLTPPAGTTERYDGNTHAMVTQDALSAGSTGSLAFAWTNGITTAFIGSLHIAGGGGSNLTATPSDNVGVTDSLTRVNDAVRAPADPVGVTDSLAVVWDRVAVISDGVGVTDPGQTSDLGANPADPVGITDSATDTNDAVRTPADPVGVTDSLTVVQTGDQVKSPSDPVGVTDSLAVVWDRVATITDSVGMVDSPASSTGVSGSVSANPTEAVGITDLLVVERTVGDVVWEFSPPTRTARRGSDSLWGRITHLEGLTVVKLTNGSYRQMVMHDPDLPNIEVVYLGGHIYRVSDTEAASLTAAGYGSCLTEVSE